jgi:hypothetical protein
LTCFQPHALRALGAHRRGRERQRSGATEHQVIAAAPGRDQVGGEELAQDARKGHVALGEIFALRFRAALAGVDRHPV